MKYYVMVTFESEKELEDPAGYVNDAVATMRGCQPPDSPEFSVDPESVNAVDVSEVTGEVTVQAVARIL